jgi:hypothetical protein
MITLENGNIQGANGLPIVPFGYIELYLNTDATIIASPYGQVLGGTKNAVRFYFDENSDLIGTPQIWSNEELNPQNIDGLGTWYVVNFFDANGTCLNNGAMIWIFPNDAGATIDIGTMVSVAGSRIYWPVPFFLYPVDANYVLIGPESGPPALPTFRPISAAFPNFVDDEVPSGTIDGTNATYTLANTPNPPTSLNLFKNGQRLTEGIGFLLDDNTITYQAGYILQPASGDIPGDTHIANYRY